MSWAAHEFESYILKKHTGSRVSFLAVLFGCLLPDLFTKLPVYGFNLGALHLTHVSEPWKYHRGWPGVGPTHSLAFVVIVAGLVLALTRNRGWFLGVLIGGWAHVLTDCFDSAGTMLFFPFTTQHYSVGMWSYASQEGRYGDASAYYSSLGGVWDGLWLLSCIANIRIFTRDYFFNEIAPHDPVWSWLQRRFALKVGTLLAIYRAYFVYGASRVVGWTLWARLMNPARGRDAVDITWGGPYWVDKAPPFQRATTWGGFVGLTAIGASCLGLLLATSWMLVGRRLWRRAGIGQFVPLVSDDTVTLRSSSIATTAQ